MSFSLTSTTARQCSLSLNAHASYDRTSFLKITFASMAAVASSFNPSIAFADEEVIGDLSMPSEGEQKAQEVRRPDVLCVEV